MNSLKNIMEEHSTMKQTENGAFAYSTTNSALLDFFSFAGSMRDRSVSDITDKFDLAFAEDPLLATKALFYVGDIRGGLGERRTFRICLKRLADTHPEIVVKNLHLVPEFNRWDSILVLLDTPVKDEVINLIDKQLKEDLENLSKKRPVSLLGKWLPSENTSSARTRELANVVRTNLGLTPRNYRKKLSLLRSYLDVVETKMSANLWSEIQYENVPSYAMNRYRNVFREHDKVGFANYIDSLKRGEAKINASVLYPYDLVNKYNGPFYLDDEDAVIEEQWKALPNYVTDANILIMADLSGSMTCCNGRPMNTSIGLAAYFAQRNKGAFANMFMTFSSDPRCVKIPENATLRSSIKAIMDRGNVGYSTSLEKAFRYLLDMCIDTDVSQEDLPSALVVISDMEIDAFSQPKCNLSFVDKWEAEFEKHGYKLPKLILWNVEARNDTVLSQNPNVLYVSGQSASTFKHFTAALNGKTGYEFMLDVLNCERYGLVQL